MKLLIILFACSFLVHVSESLPCRRSDVNVNRCLAEEIDSIKPYLKHDLIKMKRLQADASINGVKMKAVFTDFAVQHLSDFTIDSFRADLRNNRYLYGELKVTIPSLYVISDYNFRGIKMFFIGFQTYGKFHGRFNDIKLTFKMRGSTYAGRRHGIEYVKLDSVQAEVNINKAVIVLQPADRTYIGRKIARYAWSDPYAALTKLSAAIDHNVAQLFYDNVNDVLAEIPMNLILRD